MKNNTISSLRIFSLIMACVIFTPQQGNRLLAQTNSLQVYVANQGNFSDANGSITQYDLAEGMADQDVVSGLNTLVQSMTIHDGLGYILGNTSDKIDVIDLSTNERVDQIREVISPRFMKVVNEGKAYVSNLFRSSVTIIDLTDHSVQGTIPVGMNPEAIALIEEKAYVANFGFGTADSTVTVIDVATDSVVDTMQTGCDGPRFLEVDQENELWVFCNGKTVFNDDFTEIIEETNGQVVVFDSDSGDEVQRMQFDVQAGASSLGQDAWFDPASNRMFFVMGSSVVVFDASLNEQVNTIDIPGDELIGAVAYEASEGLLYLARITGFTTAGFVSIHDDSGMEVDRFTAGVAPAFIAFYDPFATNVAVEEPTYSDNMAFYLHAAYPNPSSSMTTLSFEVHTPTRLSLKIFNALGQEVARLLDDRVEEGRHSIAWEGNEPAGVYFYQLTSAEKVETKMLTLIR